MKEKIAFPQLVGLVAEKASTTERMSELFLQELFAVITQELTEGKPVTIKGLGTFKPAKDDAGNDVVFTPDKDLAEAVNAPFAQFMPVELCDEVTDEMLSEIDAAMEQPTQNEDVTTELASSEDVETGTISPEENTKDEEAKPDSPKENAKVEETKPDSSKENAKDVGMRPVSTEDAQEQQKPQEQNAPQESLVSQESESRSYRTWFIAAAAAVVLIAAWYFYTHRSKEGNDKAIETTQVAKNDSSAKSKDTKAQPVVTDTIGTTNLIFTMAQKHYGDQAFWVYIALENKAQYPDYRKIPTGAILVIPPASKYGINSDSKQSLKQANAEAMKLHDEVKAADKKDQQEDADDTKPSNQDPDDNKNHKSSHRQYHNNYSTYKKYYHRRR